MYIYICIIILGREVHLAEQPWLSMLVYSVLVDINQQSSDSRMLSLHLVFGLPLPLFPYTVPVNKSLQMSPFLNICPTKAIFRLTIAVSSLSLVPILPKTFRHKPSSVLTFPVHTAYI